MYQLVTYTLIRSRTREFVEGLGGYTLWKGYSKEVEPKGLTNFKGYQILTKVTSASIKFIIEQVNK